MPCPKTEKQKGKGMGQTYLNKGQQDMYEKCHNNHNLVSQLKTIIHTHTSNYVKCTDIYLLFFFSSLLFALILAKTGNQYQEWYQERSPLKEPGLTNCFC